MATAAPGPTPTQAQPAPGPAPSYGSASKQQVINAIQSRTQTDEIMGTFWALFALIAVVVNIVALFLGWIGFILMIVFGVLWLVLFYKMLKRNEAHFKREVLLRTALVNYFREVGNTTFKSQMIGAQLGTMESINQEAAFKEKDHMVILLVILLIIPLVNFFAMLYILYILTKEPFGHDQRWHAYSQNAQSAAQQLGMNVMTPSWKTLKERSYLLYIILSIFTLGIFAIYWVYVLVNDMNEHMQTQWQFEDGLMRELH
ncbi:MAG: DUF4234 domain-containing protein [Methanomassiliicoccales archaeon]|nr:DUF4234 domain-containing protein [Methanomassiliicoccales archaeon]